MARKTKFGIWILVLLAVIAISSTSALAGVKYVWQTEFVAFSADVPNSIALDSSDTPYISYYDSSAVYYAKKTATGWDSIPVQGSISSGGHTSIAIDSFDVPYVSFNSNHDLNPALYYYKEGSPGPNMVYSVATSGYGAPGHYNLIKLDGTTPHIVSYDPDNDQLKYDDKIVTGLSSSFYFPYPSLAIDSNKIAHISYSGFNNRLEYAKQLGPSTWDIETISFESNKFTSIDVDSSNNPHISYYDDTNQAVKYAKYVGSGGNCGNNKWRCEVIDSGPFSALDVPTSIKVDKSGNPHIAYGGAGIKYAVWNGLAWSIDTVTTGLPSHISLALDSNENPHISIAFSTSVSYATRIKCTDTDDDGYFAEGGVCGEIDCNDNDPTVYPNAPEICDGIFNDCYQSTPMDDGCTGFAYAFTTNNALTFFEYGVSGGNIKGALTKAGLTGTGLDAADYICMQEAAANPLLAGKISTGTIFKAWLSDPSSNAIGRIGYSSIPYRLADKSLIANDWNDLVTADANGNYLKNPINKDARGRLPKNPQRVWTGTNPQGQWTKSRYADCNGWTSSARVDRGQTGTTSLKNDGWTLWGAGNCFDTSAHLYCFEQSSIYCGDSIINGNEACDDGNTNNNDACTNSCQPNVCGDGFVNVGVEECDDGAANSNTISDACRTDCTLPVCGDGVKDTGERCDDGNTANGDGCSALCTVEPKIIYLNIPKIASVYKANMGIAGANLQNLIIDVNDDGTAEYANSGDFSEIVDIKDAVRAGVDACALNLFDMCRIPIKASADSGSATISNIDVEYTNYYWDTSLVPDGQQYRVRISVKEEKYS